MSAVDQVFRIPDLIAEIAQHLPEYYQRMDLACCNRVVYEATKSLLFQSRVSRFESLRSVPFETLTRMEYASEILGLGERANECSFLVDDVAEFEGEKYQVLKAPVYTWRVKDAEPRHWLIKNISTGEERRYPDPAKDEYEYGFDEAKCLSCPASERIIEHHTNQHAQEMWTAENIVPFHNELQAAVNALAASKEPDWHPGSKNIVNDLVHPALYALHRPLPEEPKPAKQGKGLGAGLGWRTRPEDFWERPMEKSEHQWLPSEIDVLDDGSVKFRSYINNMPAGQEGLTALLEQLLELLVPTWEYAWQMAKAFVTKEDTLSWGKVNYEDAGLPSFRGRRLQVVPKIVEFVLQPGQTYEGVWHYEGMSHENIVATGLYYLRKDPGIVGGELEFKRSFSAVEGTFLTHNMAQSRPRIIDEMVRDFVPLGRLETLERRLLVFINCHAHRILPMTNRSDKEQKRQFVCFFLINPDERITSTADVPPQQGVISHEEALTRRLALLEERKYQKQSLNPRLVELCEH